MIDYSVFVVEIISGYSYRVYISNVCERDVIGNGTTFDSALVSVIKVVFGCDCVYNYDFYAVSNLRTGHPCAQYVISVDNGSE